MSNENELKCFFIGIGVGVAAGFLFAPKSGAETRHLIQSKAAEGTDYIRKQAVETVERGGRKIRHQKENVVAAVEAGKAAYEEAAAATPAV